MAFFKFRKAGSAQAAAPSAPHSVEDLRRRARHRLIGASVLVSVGVVGFPLLFDKQPRPVAIDIPIEIPDKSKAPPLAEALRPAAPAVVVPAGAGVTAVDVAAVNAPSAIDMASAPQASGRVTVGEISTPTPPLPVASQATSALGAPQAAPAVVAKAVPASAVAPAPRPTSSIPVLSVPASPPVNPSAGAASARAPVPESSARKEAAKAQALLDGKPVAAAEAASHTPSNTSSPSAASAGAGRFVVQVGAYTDATKLREVRLKLERAGIKTYTQVIASGSSKRTRVRVGPFESKAAADKVAEQIKKLNLPAAMLEL